MGVWYSWANRLLQLSVCACSESLPHQQCKVRASRNRSNCSDFDSQVLLSGWEKPRYTRLFSTDTDLRLLIHAFWSQQLYNPVCQDTSWAFLFFSEQHGWSQRATNVKQKRHDLSMQKPPLLAIRHLSIRQISFHWKVLIFLPTSLMHNLSTSYNPG